MRRGVHCFLSAQQKLQWVTPTRSVEQPAENEQAQKHIEDNTYLRVKQRTVRDTGEGSCR